MPRIRADSIRAHKALTHNEILEAAAALFRAQGYEATSLGDIAGYVGIGRTTMYEYFSDKEDILASLVEGTIPNVIERIISSLPEALGAGERLGELIVRGLEFVSSDDDLGALLMRETPRLSPETQLRVRTAHRALGDEIHRVCNAGIADGIFKPFDPKITAGLVYGVLMWASEGLLRDDEAKQRIHEVAETVVQMLFGGLLLEG